MPEPPLTDAELRCLRVILSERREDEVVSRWFRTHAGVAMKYLVYISAAAVLASSVLSIIHLATQGGL